MLQTPLGPHSGNERRGPKLTPYQRGLIVGAAGSGAKPAQLAKQYKLSRDTIKSTLCLNPECKDGESKPQSGQPKAYSDRDECKILQQV
jgi:hypothetical protein